ncbi:MAG: hypothetical protein JJE13_02925 [Thermoleophilia bacterium]|nr:hypothetical protein [Thermoleophilia bacterium]
MLNPKLTLVEHFTTTLLKVATAALLIVFLVVSAVSFVPDFANAETTKRVVLGKTATKLEPNCGVSQSDRLCAAEGRVTGYQVFAKGTDQKRSFNVPFKGKIISWSISLAKPTRKFTKTVKDAQVPFFNNLFGSPAQARIAVLRQVEKRKKGPPRYKMVRQSPTQILNPYFGTTVHFALSKPLNVIPDQVVALTIPTWAPAFWRPGACDASLNGGLVNEAACEGFRKEYTWRGSRGPKKCELGGDTQEEIEASIASSHSQQKVNTVKRYGCYYDGSRLLYTATIVGK